MMVHTWQLPHSLNNLMSSTLHRDTIFTHYKAEHDQCHKLARVCLQYSFIDIHHFVHKKFLTFCTTELKTFQMNSIAKNHTVSLSWQKYSLCR